MNANQSHPAGRILASLVDGVIACDLESIVIFANPVTIDLLALSDQTPTNSLLGRKVEALFSQFEKAGRHKLAADLAVLQKEIADSKGQLPAMREVILEDDERIFSVRLAPVCGIKGACSAGEVAVILILRDISQETQVDRAKSEFISTVSHELRTPMTSINGYATLLLQGVVGPLGEQQKHFLDIIRRNIDRLSLLLNDLLDVSRIEAGKVKLELKEIQLIDLAEEVVEMLMIAADQKGLRLSLDAPVDLPLVMADKALITQVLTNLVGNAITYTEAGDVQIRLGAVADVMQVSVKDTGIGMSPEQVAHIFDQFYRADHEVVQANTGTGLGLSIVERFVEMHGGRIWVESELNKGSTFTFILPLANK